MHQQQFEETSAQNIVLAAGWSWPSAWTLRVGGRLAGQTWDEAPVTVYDHLTTEELHDVICAEVARILEIW